MDKRVLKSKAEWHALLKEFIDDVLVADGFGSKQCLEVALGFSAHEEGVSHLSLGTLNYLVTLGAKAAFVPKEYPCLVEWSYDDLTFRSY